MGHFSKIFAGVSRRLLAGEIRLTAQELATAVIPGVPSFQPICDRLLAVIERVPTATPENAREIAFELGQLAEMSVALVLPLDKKSDVRNRAAALQQRMLVHSLAMWALSEEFQTALVKAGLVKKPAAAPSSSANGATGNGEKAKAVVPAASAEKAAAKPAAKPTPKADSDTAGEGELDFDLAEPAKAQEPAADDDLGLADLDEDEGGSTVTLVESTSGKKA